MNEPLRVGIVGDFNPSSRFHLATNEALLHAGKALSSTVQVSWLPTQTLDQSGYETVLEQFDALWCSPGSPYISMKGALKAIRFARERGWPFVGT